MSRKIVILVVVILLSLLLPMVVQATHNWSFGRGSLIATGWEAGLGNIKNDNAVITLTGWATCGGGSGVESVTETFPVDKNGRVNAELILEDPCEGALWYQLEIVLTEEGSSEPFKGKFRLFACEDDGESIECTQIEGPHTPPEGPPLPPDCVECVE